MNKQHPKYPQSNILKFNGYDPEMYALGEVPFTVRTDESLIQGRTPCLTQQTVGMYLQPLSRELAEMPLRPSIKDLPEAVIDNMVRKDRAFWVDKPGANAYTLHSAYYNYGVTTEIIKPPHQNVFPRSYQYDLDCVKYRRHHACDGIREKMKLINTECRDCIEVGKILSADLSTDVKSESETEKWRYYPDLNSKLSAAQIRELMDEVGKPFKNEACNWFYKRYPPLKFNCILRKFSK